MTTNRAVRQEQIESHDRIFRIAAAIKRNIKMFQLTEFMPLCVGGSRRTKSCICSSSAIWQSTGRQLPYSSQQSAVSSKLSAIIRQQSAVSHHPSAVSSQQLPVSRQPSVVSSQPSAVSRQQPAVRSQESGVRSQESAVSRRGFGGRPLTGCRCRSPQRGAAGAACVASLPTPGVGLLPRERRGAAAAGDAIQLVTGRRRHVTAGG